MSKLNPKIDAYLSEGCGRCPLGNTPQCKVNKWTEVLQTLRNIVLDCGLTEELKWSVPCYTFQNSNIAIVAAFNDYAVLSFFKGALLRDDNGLLIQQTENMQSARQIRFTNVQDIIELEPVLKAYVYEAIEVEKAGLKVETKPNQTPIPEELQQSFAENPDFKVAFERLTAGRQRGYLLHFSQPKQAQTRAARIEKCMLRIFDGKGLND
jgi:uncharacterized protein YdeI (YjbR/CyaY-like superfamily)